MSQQLTPEQRKERTEFIVKLVGLGGIALLVGPFMVTILHGLGALLAVAATVGVAYVVQKMWGVFALMVANWHLKALKAEATRNPVETLQTEYVKKQQALSQFKQQLIAFIAEVNNFAAKVRDYVKQGLEDAPIYQEQLAKMIQLQELRKQKYTDAEDSLAEFAEAIRRTDTKWKMACAAAHMSEAAGDMEGEVFDKICIETAIESVQTKLNQSFADLDLALLDDANSKKAADSKKLNQLAGNRVAAQIADKSIIDVDATTTSVPRQKISVS
jgi:hypothetical protein